ncbi:uncharacterized protein LOC129225318 [Uloborus diversus]|uniref:uncharacterized protein LOC129225318 n=1 Tax=Uloborus diversus TaxID=327109 RepID=UPI002409BEC1|nr:uncharacterized protein LOC129225318 [Uloborus diversus]
MVSHCCVSECKERSAKGGRTTFHYFPKDETRRKLWESKIGRKNFKASDHSRICSKHFSEDCFDRLKFGATWLKPNAIPTIFNFPAQSKKGNKKGKSKIKIEVTEEKLPIETEFTGGKSTIKTEIMEDESPIKTEVTEESFPIITEGEFPIITEGAFPIITEGAFPIITNDTQGVFPPMTNGTESESPIITEVTGGNFSIKTEVTEESFPIITEGTYPIIIKDTQGVFPTITNSSRVFPTIINGSGVFPTIINGSGVFPIITEVRGGKSLIGPEGINSSEIVDTEGNAYMEEDLEKRKRQHYLGDFTIEDMNSPEKARKFYRAALERNEVQNKKLKSLREDMRTLKRRVTKLQRSLSDVAKKSPSAKSKLSFPGPMA